MTEEKMSPLRARMLEDIHIRGMGDKARKSHIRAIKDFAKFLAHSPDTLIRPLSVLIMSRLPDR